MKTMNGQTYARLSETGNPYSRAWQWLSEAVGQLVNSDDLARRRAWAKTFIVAQGMVVFAVAFGIPAAFASCGVDLHHDGIMFKPALDVAQGKMVFRDTFTQYGGVTVLIQAAALAVFGKTLFVIRLQTALMYGAAYFVFWRAWCRLIPAPLAAFVCIVGSMMGPDAVATSFPWSSVYSAFFQGLTLLFALRYLERGREWELFASGASAALAFWCRQPVGVFLSMGMAVALAAIALRVTPFHGRSPSAISARALFGRSWLGRLSAVALLFGGGLLVVNGVILLWLATYGALLDWWKQSIVFAKVFGEHAGQGFALKHIVDSLIPSGDLRVFSLLVIPVAIQTIRSTAPFLDPRSKMTGVEAAKGLLISVVAITSWLQYYPIACLYHCYWASIPMYGVFAYLFYSLHSSPSRVAKSMVAVTVIGLVFYKDVTWRIDSWAPRQNSQNSTITSISTLRGMRTWEAERRSYDALAPLIDAYHRVYPEGGIVTTTRHALFPALTLKQAYYHPLYVIWEDLMPKTFPEALPARAEYIKEKLPMVIGALDSPTTHVRVASLWWGGPMDVYVPKDTHPTEFVTCEGSGPCRRIALQN